MISTLKTMQFPNCLSIQFSILYDYNCNALHPSLFFMRLLIAQGFQKKTGSTVSKTTNIIAVILASYLCKEDNKNWTLGKTPNMSFNIHTIKSFAWFLSHFKATFDIALWIKEVTNLLVVYLKHWKCDLILFSFHSCFSFTLNLFE